MSSVKGVGAIQPKHYMFFGQLCDEAKGLVTCLCAAGSICIILTVCSHFDGQPGLVRGVIVIIMHHI